MRAADMLIMRSDRCVFVRMYVRSRCHVHVGQMLGACLISEDMYAYLHVHRIRICTFVYGSTPVNACKNVYTCTESCHEYKNERHVTIVSPSHTYKLCVHAYVDIFARTSLHKQRAYPCHTYMHRYRYIHANTHTMIIHTTSR